MEIYFLTPTPFRSMSLSPASNKKNLNPIVFMLLCTCLATNASDDLQSKHGPNSTVNLKHMYEHYATQIIRSYFNCCNFIRFFHTIRNYRLHLACFTPRQKYVFITNCFQSLRIEFIVNICKIRYADKYSV